MFNVAYLLNKINQYNQIWTVSYIFVFLYSSNYLIEITNVRSVGKADLWANIGGYVGMVMGISILQLIDIMYDMITRFQDRYYLQDI